MAFTLKMGINGLLYGVGFGSIIQMLAYCALIKFSDWDKIAVKVAEDHAKAKMEKIAEESVQTIELTLDTES